MSKRTKKARKLEREHRRAAARRAERQRTVVTAIVVGIVVVLGAVLVLVSLQEPGADDLAAELEDLPDEPTPLEEPDPADQPPPPDPAEDERPVACGAELPAGAGEPRPTFDEPEDVLEDGVDYRAVVETSCGTVVVDLDEDDAPETVNSFVFLAQQGFFDGLEVFRNATSIAALQTGAGNNQASWTVGYALPDELDTAEDAGYPPGSLAMANAGPNTAGSQFFFVYDDLFDEAIAGGGLQAAYSRFGMVTEGLDVLEQIGAIEVEGETPQEQVYLEQVTIETR